MKKRLLCSVLALMLLCGCGRQTVVAETVEVSATVYDASGSTSAQSGKVTAAKNTKATQTSSTSTKSKTTTIATKSTTTTTPKSNTASVKNKVGEKKWNTKMEVKSYYRNGKKIYGEIYRPVGNGQFPALVICHGLNGSCGYAREMAKYFAENGVVTYIFDFIGGSLYNKSEGSMTEMSMLTEAADFNVVFNAISALSYVDKTRMFVMGESAGGYVATYIAGTRPNDVKGLITLYPAYNLPGASLKMYLPFIPSRMELYGCVLGRKFFEDLTKVDIYKVMANFNGKTVIIHGTSDDLVPVSYSEKAVKTMKNAKLVKVAGGKHGFGGTATVRTEALKLMKEVANN